MIIKTEGQMTKYFTQKLTRHITASLALMSTAVLAVPAQATDLWCTTKIGAMGTAQTSVWVQMDANNGNKWTMVCDLSSTVNGTTAQGCQGMLSTILTAKATGKTITMHLGGPGTYVTCSQMPDQWNGAISSTWTAITD
jgi:hypothetical protein